MSASARAPLATGPGADYQKSEAQILRDTVASRARLRDRLVAAIASVVVVVTVGYLVWSSPGWSRVQSTFFSWSEMKAAMPSVVDGFWLNVRMFLIAEPIILAFALFIALLRRVNKPVLFPLRMAATAYVDFFRGVPTILVIFVVGFGLPALQLQGVPEDPVVLGLSALVLSYSAYVAEVFRAGIESISSAQWSAARSMGLTHGQTMRFVVLPQAVRRVVPPLLNDFISLMKDTALVAVIGPLEALRQAQIYGASNFNYAGYVVAAVLFLVVTIPLARFTDHLAGRAARRQQAGGNA